MHFQEEITPQIIREWIESRYIIFIFDGFDEISEENRNNVAEWIENLSFSTSRTSIIITCRPLTSDQLTHFNGHWTRWNIMPFDKKRVIRYIKLWHDNTPLLPNGVIDVNPEQLAQQLLSDPIIGPLTSNPLLLSTLLMVHHLDGKLPNGRSQLYERYVDGMLGVWDDRRNVTAKSIPLLPREKNNCFP